MKPLLAIALCVGALLPHASAAQTPPFALKWGSFGSGDGQFYYPASVAVDGTGCVYVADQVNHRVQKFSSTGAYLAQWGSYGYEDGQFRSPSGVAVDAQGYVYVSDYENGRVEKFTSNGAFVTKFGSGNHDGPDNLASPLGLAVDANGNVYVADEILCQIVVFTSSGAPVTRWGGYGTASANSKNLQGSRLTQAASSTSQTSGTTA
jgi:sugar lactone lactonase YvrE